MNKLNLIQCILLITTIVDIFFWKIHEVKIQKYILLTMKSSSMLKIICTYFNELSEIQF